MASLAHQIDSVYSICQSQIVKLKSYLQQKRANRDNDILKKISIQEKQNNKLYQMQRTNFVCHKKLKGHFGKIWSLCWSKTENVLISVSQDGRLIMFNVDTTNRLSSISLRTAWVMTCDISPSGKYVAVGGLNNLVSVYNIQLGKQNWNYNDTNGLCELQEHEGYTASVKFIDDDRILSASGDGTVKLWDIDKQKCLKTFVGHHGDMAEVAINLEKSLFICASVDSQIYLHDLRSKISSRPIARFTGHQTDVNALKWFPDNNAFISGSDDSTIRLWDIRCFQQLNIYSDPNIFRTVTSVDCSHSGYYVFGGYDDNPHCVVWNAMTGENEQVLSHPHRVSVVRVSPNGESLATGCWDKLARIWGKGRKISCMESVTASCAMLC